MGQKIKVYLLTVLILLSCLLVGCTSTANDNKVDDSTAAQIQVPEVLKDMYVYDQGNIISDDQEAVINNLLVQLEEKTTVEFAVITIPSLNNLTIEQYAVKLANTLGIGKVGEDNGILLLVSKTDTKVRLEIGRGLQGFLTDSVSGRILDKYFVPSREKDNYNDACFNTVNAVINCIANSEDYEFSGIEGLDPEIAVEETDGKLTAGQVIGIIALIIFLLILELITGRIFGDGFGDGLVFMILHIILSSRSGGSGGSRGGSFGGGRFNGGGSSR